MITHIQGRLVEKNPTEVIIDCNGIGYFVNISLHTFSQLPATENVKLYTHLLVREDAHILYGFSEKAEREIFRLLLSVSGSFWEHDVATDKVTADSQQLPLQTR